MGAARATPYTASPNMRGMLLNTIYTMMLAWLIWSQQYANGASSDMGYARPNIRKIKWSREAPVIQDAQYTSNHSESRAISNQRQLIESCSKADITILQGQSSPMPSGIPTFSVQIFNMCVAAGCSISNIHIASAACTSRDISISQNRDDTPGIPEFIVQIINTCTTGCTPSEIHLNCGWFASTGTINPKVFKRIAYDDCLVNGGGPLPREGIVRFTYRNSFMYPLTFKSAKFC